MFIRIDRMHERDRQTDRHRIKSKHCITDGGLNVEMCYLVWLHGYTANDGW